MPLKTGTEYVTDLKEINPSVYFMGEEIDVTEHPVLRASLKATAQTYDLAHDSNYTDLSTADSPLIGEKVNRFNHIISSLDDLINRVQFLRTWQNLVGSCALRCTGCAALNGLYAATYDMDQRFGTGYHQRFLNFVKSVQKNDLYACSGMMDVKGDRKLGPSEQSDPDMFLRVVEERPDGVVVRGAKAHQSAACLAHEILVVPSRVLTEKDKSYAIAFAVANGTPGVIHIMQHSMSDSRALVAEDMDLGNVKYGTSFGGCSLMIFNDVFIPNERIFMKGEYEYSRILMRNFACLARMWEGGCRPGLLDLLLGAGQAIAEYNGIAKASHIQQKLTDIAYMAETIYGCTIGACQMGEASPSGVYFPHGMMCSVSKLQAIDAYYEASKLAVDLAGGLVMTLPSEKDFRHPELGAFLEKYLKGTAEVPTEHRIRMLRFIESLTSGSVACALHHGGGPIQAQRVTIWQASGVQDKKKMAQVLAGIAE